VRALATALILIAGILNLVPAIGVLSTGRLQALYGVPISDPNIAILMRHRAVLFAIVGALLVAAAFRPALRPVGVVAGLVSMGSFVVLALVVGNANAALVRVAVVDALASLGLVAAALIDLRSRLLG
jgi:hypothetical protein